jgi:hypothetical protein
MRIAGGKQNLLDRREIVYYYRRQGICGVKP